MLKIDNLVAGYGKVQVLHGISIEVPKGKVVALIGSNGAGKTTTLRAISGMVKPQSGSVSINKRDVAGLDSFEIARLGLAHSPEGRRVFPTLPVIDNILLGAFPRVTGARAKGDVTADIDRMFNLFPRLKERRAQLAGTLSGGEQQMLAMARALMLLDEPSMGLAPRLVDEIFSIIRQLRSINTTLLLVEQFAAAALDVSDFGYVMENGHIRMSGEAKALASDPAIRDVYLGGGH